MVLISNNDRYVYVNTRAESQQQQRSSSRQQQQAVTSNRAVAAGSSCACSRAVGSNEQWLSVHRGCGPDCARTRNAFWALNACWHPRCSLQRRQTAAQLQAVSAVVDTSEATLGFKFRISLVPMVLKHVGPPATPKATPKQHLRQLASFEDFFHKCSRAGCCRDGVLRPLRSGRHFGVLFASEFQ